VSLRNWSWIQYCLQCYLPPSHSDRNLLQLAEEVQHKLDNVAQVLFEFKDFFGETYEVSFDIEYFLDSYRSRTVDLTPDSERKGYTLTPGLFRRWWHCEALVNTYGKTDEPICSDTSECERLRPGTAEEMKACSRVRPPRPNLPPDIVE
jgi:hypothetical protein